MDIKEGERGSRLRPLLFKDAVLLFESFVALARLCTTLELHLSCNEKSQQQNLT